MCSERERGRGREGEGRERSKGILEEDNCSYSEEDQCINDIGVGDIYYSLINIINLGRICSSL